MNLEAFKSTWKSYDKTVQTHQPLSEQTVRQMIKDRSASTLATMERNLQRAGLIMTGVILFFLAAAIGNAFDYPRWYFYIPSALYIGLATVALKVIVTNYRHVKRVNLSQQNLYESLTTVLQEHEKAQFILSKVWLLCMLAGFLFGVSMVGRKLDTYGPVTVLSFLGFQALLILSLYAAARWIFRLFEDKTGAELKTSIQELDALKNVE
ncbi:hypothetical protein GCM10027347_16130 [Larkinella harenae]